jgi:hypothetical protein
MPGTSNPFPRLTNLCCYWFAIGIPRCRASSHHPGLVNGQWICRTEHACLPARQEQGGVDDACIKASASQPWDWSILPIIKGGEQPGKANGIGTCKTALSDTGAASGAVQPALQWEAPLHTQHSRRLSRGLPTAGAAQHSGGWRTPLRPVGRPPPPSVSPRQAAPNIPQAAARSVTRHPAGTHTPHHASTSPVHQPQGKPTMAMRCSQASRTSFVSSRP